MDKPTVQYLINIAIKAGIIIREGFNKNNMVTWKSDSTPVTSYDLQINDAVVAQIKKDFPHVSILAEEGSHFVKDSIYTVVCDPIDGTTPFMMGVPVSAFCISLLKSGVPVLACIYDPFMDRMYCAKKGSGTSLNGNKIIVSKKNTLVRAHIGTIWWKGSNFNLDKVNDVLLKLGINWVPPYSIAYSGALIASGNIDATLFPSLKPWETAALKLLIEEAGGKVTDIYGKDQKYDRAIRGHIASNGHIHDELVEIIKAHN